jgi:hypothetical protein
MQRAVYDLIRLASALGIIVVEAAGNGGTNVGDLQDVDGRFVLRRGGRDFRDSGAILVAAGQSAARTRDTDSNFGPRVNCFAWGDNVRTLSNAGAVYQFADTSSAAAIVAGAAILVQSATEQQRSYRLSPGQVRRILSNPALPGNTRSANYPAEGIRVMPNLRHILQNVLGIVPDIYIRDFVGDIGNPHNGAASSSPDIIVRQTAIANPQQTYGEGSGTENQATLSSAVQAGRNHYIYLRARNRGGRRPPA